jgi:hypothetical protein
MVQFDRPSVSPRIAGVVVVALLLFGGWLYLARPDHKYRLTINVETPEGIKSASGVFAVHLSKDPPLLPGVGSIGFKGDAIFVDLGEGRNVIAILAHGSDGIYVDGLAYIAQRALTSAGHRASFKEVSAFAGTSLTIKNTRLIPTLISFSDLTDPRTARVVRPDDLQSIFGQDYRLASVTLTIIPVGLWPFDFGGLLGKPVTRGIKTQLPWWNNSGRPALLALKSAGLATASSIDAEYAFERP